MSKKLPRAFMASSDSYLASEKSPEVIAVRLCIASSQTDLLSTDAAGKALRYLALSLRSIAGSADLYVLLQSRVEAASLNRKEHSSSRSPRA